MSQVVTGYVLRNVKRVNSVGQKLEQQTIKIEIITHTKTIELRIYYRKRLYVSVFASVCWYVGSY